MTGSVAETAAIQRGAEAVAQAIVINRADCPDTFVPGDIEYDGSHALAELFGFCLGAEADLVPSELRAIIARFADAGARAFKEELDTASEERTSVRISRADGTIVYVGPYDFRFQAEEAAAHFGRCASSVGGAQGATAVVVAYEAGEPHRFGMFSGDENQIAVLMQTDDSDDFPDLYTRLAAFHGDRAPALWHAACNLLGAPDQEAASA